MPPPAPTTMQNQSPLNWGTLAGAGLGGLAGLFGATAYGDPAGFVDTTTRKGFGNQAFGSAVNRGTNQALNLYNQTRGQIPGYRPAMDLYRGTLRGDYLYGGEGFDAALEQANRRVLPGLSSAWAGAGRSGSGLAQEAVADAISGNFAGLYDAERNRQMGALALAPQMATLKATPLNTFIDQLNTLGQVQPQTITTSNPYFENPLAGALGGAAAGADIASRLFPGGIGDVLKLFPGGVPDWLKDLLPADWLDDAPPLDPNVIGTGPGDGPGPPPGPPPGDAPPPSPDGAPPSPPNPLSLAPIVGDIAGTGSLFAGAAPAVIGGLNSFALPGATVGALPAVGAGAGVEAGALFAGGTPILGGGGITGTVGAGAGITAAGAGIALAIPAIAYGLHARHGPAREAGRKALTEALTSVATGTVNEAGNTLATVGGKEYEFQGAGYEDAAGKARLGQGSQVVPNTLNERSGTILHMPGRGAFYPLADGTYLNISYNLDGELVHKVTNPSQIRAWQRQGEQGDRDIEAGRGQD